MRVAQIIDDFSVANGGLTTALQQLVENSTPLGVQSTVFHVGRSVANRVSGEVIYAPAPLGAAWCLSAGLFRRLGQDLNGFDLVHVHGIWRAPQLAGLHHSRTLRLPVLLTPHNMLGGWLWRRSLWKRAKKAIYFRAFADLYQSSTGIHALSQAEAESLREFFPHQPIEVIPNGIDLSHRQIPFEARVAPYFLYLGRLVPGKGLELLIDAFGSFGARNQIRLVLAGASADPRYEMALREQARARGIAADIDWVGQVSGETKQRFLGQATAVFLPSFAEGVSMVALEALAASTPLVASREIGVPEIANHGGLNVDLHAESLRCAMERVVLWSPEERAERGRRSLELARNVYSWDSVAPRMHSLYKRCLERHSGVRDQS
jgi:glycosyltransferase involved in cell wall biosynthesis